MLNGGNQQNTLFCSAIYKKKSPSHLKIIFAKALFNGYNIAFLLIIICDAPAIPIITHIPFQVGLRADIQQRTFIACKR